MQYNNTSTIREKIKHLSTSSHSVSHTNFLFFGAGSIFLALLLGYFKKKYPLHTAFTQPVTAAYTANTNSEKKAQSEKYTQNRPKTATNNNY